MTKELFIACHEELIAEAVENGMDEAEAYDKTADKAYDRMRDRYADMIDAAKQRAKDDGNWPPNSRSPKP
jgi:hypothetical protein